MTDFEQQLSEKSQSELENLADYYAKLHKQARNADNAIAGRNNPERSQWDNNVKEYMDKLRAIDSELLSR